MKWMGYLGVAALVASLTLGMTDAGNSLWRPDGLLARPPAQDAQPARDAAVTDATASSYQVTQGDTVTITVTVENRGTESWGSRGAPFLLYNGPRPVSNPNSGFVAGRIQLEAGGSGTLDLDWDTTGATLGDYSLTVVASLRDPVPENDSFALPVITIQEAVTAVDAAVTNATASSHSVIQGDTLIITVTVSNRGTEEAAVPIRVFSDTTPTPLIGGSVTVPAGSDEELSLMWNTSAAFPGDYALTVTAYLSGDDNPDNDSFTFGVITVEEPEPEITLGTEIAPGDGSRVETPDAYLFGDFSQPGETVGTPKTPLGEIFISGPGVTNERAMFEPNVDSTGSDLVKIFVANADATFGASTVMEDPFRHGEVKGKVKLDYQDSSLGAFLEAGDLRFFAAKDGSFHGMVPFGKVDLAIRAPGFLPVVIPDATINPGEVLTIPLVTLPFGDGDGNGHINMVDFAVAARNFGFTVREMDLP